LSSETALSCQAQFIERANPPGGGQGLIRIFDDDLPDSPKVARGSRRSAP
jgi:hypothetical protein